MISQPKKHLSPWITWSIIALAVGAVIFACWNYSNQIATIYDNSIFVNPKKSIKTEKVATTPSTVSTTTATPTTTEVLDWKTYENSAYGFTMKFNDEWEGFKAVSRKSTDNPYEYDSIYFALPTTDSSWQESSLAQLEDFATPFVISVYTLENWDKAIAESQGGPMPAEITKDGKYVFAYEGWQACPTDLCDKNLDVKGIIETFKFN